MPGKPTIPVQRVRQKVREVLILAHGNPLTEAQIREGVMDLLGRDVGLQAIRDALEWNHGEAFVRSEYFEEAEMTGWIITKAGINHDRIK